MPPKRILCLEDNEDTSFMLNVLLSRQEFEVVSAADAGEALRLTREQKFAVYVIDVQLPAMSGLEFCLEARGAGDETPILIYTAAAYEADRAEGMRAGANAYLVKPGIDEVVPTVMRLLEEAATARDSGA